MPVCGLRKGYFFRVAVDRQGTSGAFFFWTANPSLPKAREAEILLPAESFGFREGKSKYLRRRTSTCRVWRATCLTEIRLFSRIFLSARTRFSVFSARTRFSILLLNFPPAKENFAEPFKSQLPREVQRKLVLPVSFWPLELAQ